MKGVLAVSVPDSSLGTGSRGCTTAMEVSFVNSSKLAS